VLKEPVVGKLKPKDLLYLLLTGALSLLACCYYFDCFSWADLSRPWYVFYDVPLMQTYAKVAAEGEALPHLPRMVHRLNAPFIANWSDFPTPEEIIWDFCGLLTYFFGVVRSYNLTILVCHVLAGTGFYVAARLLGASRAPALFCAVNYSMTRYIFVRDTVHINLSFDWHLPFFWIVSGWLWKGRPITRKGWIALLALCAATAWQNPYYWFFWLLMLLPCWAVPILQRQFRRAWPALLLSATSVFLLFLGQVDSLLGWMAYGKGHPFVRTINELQLYSLRLPEFLLPQGHHWARFDEFAHLHYYMPMVGSSGETDSAYLGFMGILTMIYLAVAGVRAILRRERVPFAFGMSLWLAAFMISGGLTMGAASLGLMLFRATGRGCILLQAGWLLFLAMRLTHWKTFAGKRVLLLLPLLLFNAWDLIPPYLADRDRAATYLANQQSTVDFLEKKLPARSMVFQWPIEQYPESPMIREVWNYEELFGYLLSHDLRFSYGDCRNRPESAWQYRMIGKSPEAMEQELQSYGFSALWLYSHGLSNEELRPWKKWQRKPDYVSPEGNLWVYLLQPAAKPVLPKLEPCIVFGPAFWGEERDDQLGLRWRWVWGKARIDLLLPSPCPYRLRFGLSALGRPRQIEIRLDGRHYQTALAPAQYGVYWQVDIDLSNLKSGDHRLELIPDGPALPPLSDGRRLTFQYINGGFVPLEGPQR